MTTSLRTRLTLAIVLVTGPVVAALVGMLYVTVQRSMWSEFHDEMFQTAEIFGNLVEWDVEDGYELDGGEAIAGLLRNSATPTHVAIETPDGMLIESERLSQIKATHPDAAVGPDVTQMFYTPQDVRVLYKVVAAQTDAGIETGHSVGIWVVRDTDRIEKKLADLAGWFWVFGVGTVLLASFVAGVTVRRGLRPLTDLGRGLDGVKEPGDAIDLPRDGLPLELKPVVTKLESLLGRLGETFDRERRFTADVSHELRTPLTVLRTSLDVALQGDRDGEDYRSRLTELRDAVDGMSRMVESLLLLSRAESGSLPVSRDDVVLADLVRACWRPFAEVAAARGLTLSVDVPVAHHAVVDSDKLRMIVTNLLSNAVEYTASGGTIRVTPGEGDVLLEVRDSGPPVDAADLERVFDPFWRADEARSAAGVHCGIGLPLARSLARAQGLDLTLENDGDEVVASIRRGDG